MTWARDSNKRNPDLIDVIVSFSLSLIITIRRRRTTHLISVAPFKTHLQGALQVTNKKLMANNRKQLKTMAVAFYCLVVSKNFCPG